MTFWSRSFSPSMKSVVWLKSIKDFVSFWAENKDKLAEVWLPVKLQEHLPEKSAEEIQSISNEIIESIETAVKAKESLGAAISSGRSKECWFASQAQKATSGMSAQEAFHYLADLDVTLQNANNSLYRTITTKAGVIN